MAPEAESGRGAAHQFTGTALVYPASDLPDQWIGVCPEFGVVTQGNDLRHALEMVWEATDLAIIDDLEHDRDPAWRSALTAQRDWQLLAGVYKSGRPIKLDEATIRRRDIALVAPMYLSYEGFASKLREWFPCTICGSPDELRADC